MGDFKDSFNCCTDPGNIDWDGHSRADLYCISDSDRDRNCCFYSFQIMIRKIDIAVLLNIMALIGCLSKSRKFFVKSKGFGFFADK